MKTRSPFLILVSLIVLSACRALGPAASAPASTQAAGGAAPTVAAPAEAAGALSYPAPRDLPQNEREVPRVSLADAQAALASGVAIVVDVRSPATFEVSHIPGAINVPLGEIEQNPAGQALPRDRWIITYCT